MFRQISHFLSDEIHYSGILNEKSCNGTLYFALIKTSVAYEFVQIFGQSVWQFAIPFIRRAISSSESWQTLDPVHGDAFVRPL